MSQAALVSAEKIVAVVMTYNRQQLLIQCLRAVLAQTFPLPRILVIDNASTDGTSEMLAADFPEVQVRRMPENVGCTGAMREALSVGLAHGAHYVWLLDDDLIPFPSCLQTIVEQIQTWKEERQIGIVAPLISDPETGEVKGGGMSCGGLLYLEMITNVPFPRTDLFLGFDDKMYTRLIRKSGYEVVRLPVVLAHHPIRKPTRLHVIVGKGYRAQPWRLYYEIRNRIYFSLYVEPSLAGFLRSVGVGFRKFLLLTLFGRPRKGQSFVIKGIIDGLFGRLGRRVEPPY